MDVPRFSLTLPLTLKSMNQIKLTLRAADHPRVIKEDNGIPSFATVFAIHNPFRNGRAPEAAIPITVKASDTLASILVESLSKGARFTVEGQLTYFKNPATHRESYSIRADQFTEITPPKSTTE